jgi:hypothetical protein
MQAEGKRNFRPGSNPSQKRISQMAKAKRKYTTAKTADADLFKLHDKFAAAYRKMKEWDLGAVENGTKEQKARWRKWESALREVTDIGHAIVVAKAFTLEGMLMKLHVVGFVIDDTKPGTFDGPYQKGAPQRPWEPGKFCGPSAELSLVISLRDDLRRFSGRPV